MSPRSWFKSAPLSDAEYVERIRQGVARYERWRWWFVMGYGILACAVLAMILWAGIVVAGLGRFFGNQNIALAGFGVGIAIGVSVGLLVVKIIHDLFTWLTPWRTEHLLLRYNDALTGLAQEPMVKTASERGTPLTPTVLCTVAGPAMDRVP